MAMWRSKLGNQYPRADIDKLDRQNHATLKRLRALPENSKCAECGAGDTAWASANLGVFVCVRCADVHRHLGTHISKPKGCGGTYLWGPDEIQQMESVGNRRARAIFCACDESRLPRISPESSKEELVDFCNKKYGHRLWANEELKRALHNSTEVSAAIVKAASEKTSSAPEHRGAAAPVLPQKAKAAEAPTLSRVEVVQSHLPAPVQTRPLADPFDWDDIFTEIEGASEVSESMGNVATSTWHDLESCFGSAPDDARSSTQSTGSHSYASLHSDDAAFTKELSADTQKSLSSFSAPGLSVPYGGSVRQAEAEQPTKSHASPKGLDMDSFFAEWGL